MKRLLCVCVILGAGSVAFAADTRPYKLGTFEARGKHSSAPSSMHAIVIDLGAAASALRKPAPRDMRDLIARCDTRMRDLIVASVTAERPSYAMDLGKVRTLAPVIPMTMMNAAVNYYEHAAEMNGSSAATTAPQRARRACRVCGNASPMTSAGTPICS